MKENFQKSLDLVLVHEGGYSDHSADPGGATNMGITHRTLAAWRGRRVSKDDVRKLTRKEAGDIYKARYWDNVRADRLPSGLDYAMFDFAVNSGSGRATRHLQAIVGAKRDGVLGPMTLRSVGRYGHSTTDLVTKLCQGRLAWLKTLRTFTTFGRGWSRRVKEVQKAALEMIE